VRYVGSDRDARIEKRKFRKKCIRNFSLSKKSFGEWGFFLLRSSRENIPVLA
jgi:hypothetical protein